MAAHSVSTSILSLGRINGPIISQWAINGHRLNRVTYATAVSTNKSRANRGFPDRDNRGLLRKPRREAGEPRTDKMAVDQDWTAVYPSATPFRHASVPLPVRMGYPVNKGVPPEKMGNLELIKIPNFLHLTPAAIKKHTEALKVFCTEWPSALDSDGACDVDFPIKVESKTFVSAGLSLRNPAARIVTLSVKLSSLNLDDHARKKMVKLLGERYCKKTDTLTIVTDSCPLRQQNDDYAHYLLTVLYHESWKTEGWEAEKTAADMEQYSWDASPSQTSLLDTLVRMQAPGGAEEGAVREEILGRSEVQAYRDAVTRLKNEGESESSMLQYREAVKKLLNI
ncbi:small ribosomal subunit protein mS35 [Osmerus mordax]|uniref:small ribosomal subunit protein mS35 n=1 Tax=Osmerus mordax TaxID=8014 RepID=UPI0035109030